MVLPIVYGGEYPMPSDQNRKPIEDLIPYLKGIVKENDATFFKKRKCKFENSQERYNQVLLELDKYTLFELENVIATLKKEIGILERKKESSSVFPILIGFITFLFSFNKELALTLFWQFFCTYAAAAILLYILLHNVLPRDLRGGHVESSRTQKAIVGEVVYPAPAGRREHICFPLRQGQMHQRGPGAEGRISGREEEASGTCCG